MTSRSVRKGPAIQEHRWEAPVPLLPWGPIAILLDKREGLFLGCPLCDSNVCGDLSPGRGRFPRHLLEPAGELIELPFAGERGGLVPGRCLRRDLRQRR